MKVKGAKTTSQQAYYLLTYQDEHPGILYWVTESHHDSEVAYSSLQMLQQVLKVDTSVFLLDTLSIQSGYAYQQLSQSVSGIYIIEKNQLDLHDQVFSSISEHLLTLKKGAVSQPVDMKKVLLKAGYEDDTDLDYYFQAKGGSITIKSGIGEVKVIFDEDSVESLRLNGVEQDYIDLPPLQLDKNYVPVELKKAPEAIRAWEGNMFVRYEARMSLIFTELSLETDVELSFLPIPKIHRDFPVFANELNELKKKGYQIMVTALDIDIVSQICEQQKCSVDEVTIIHQLAPLQGFIDKEQKFALITHSDIFGREKSIKQRRRRSERSFIEKLTEGDYIVHQDHGVARYIGVEPSVIEGHKRENLVLEYAKGDRLFVPVEMAFKVEKYVGEAKPKLQRLSGTSWIRLSKKASQESQAYAKELLKLYANRSLSRVDAWMIHKDADKQMHETFDYTETPDQESAIQDVYESLGQSIPADHLVVGDVGFGKTEVAIRAAYQSVLNGKQVAVLCPTTLLAQQHYDTFSKRFENLNVKVEMLSRFTGKTEKHTTKAKDIITGLHTGAVDIIIGTHRLLSKDIQFQDMGLLIIDEEQRFGVKHKESLKSLRPQVHILTLSATPIPRTLYFALSGLREISTISTPPKGRQPIETNIQPYDETVIKKAIQNELKRGGQVFYLYNNVRTILTAKKKLQDLLGSKVKIDIVHGQMPESEMARVTHEFDQGKIDLLICSTIIENGIDLPNVNTLIVEKANMFGLGQLYQIRGRIGRGQVKAHAYFMYSEDGLTGIAQKRLEILEEAKALGSGLQLATRDLELRGIGQLLGQKQHGHIKSVGLSAYGKLLKQAVEEFETGEIVNIKPLMRISLPVDYGIPLSLAENTEERVQMYQQFSSVQTLKELEEIKEGIDMRSLSESEHDLLSNFLQILELRLRGKKTKVIAIDYQESRVLSGELKKTLEIDFQTLTPVVIDKIYQKVADFKVIENRVVIDASQISNFYTFIKGIFTVLTK